MIKFKVAHSFTGTGLGYQTSIYVFLKSLSLTYGYDICCDEYDLHNAKSTFKNVQFDCPAKKDSEFSNVLDISGLSFNDLIDCGLKDDTLLVGHPILNSKYDYNTFETLKRQLVFRDEVQNKCSSFLKQFEGDNIISLHVRRGDYTHDCAGGLFICGEDYYKEALDKFDPTAKVLVFTNDKEFVLSCDTFKDERITVVTDIYNNNKSFDNKWVDEIDYEIDFSGNHRFYYKYAIAKIAHKHNISINDILKELPKDYIYKIKNNLYNMSFDLCLMTMCKNHILSNSTFGLWGLMLSSTERVVYPKYWIHPHNEYQPGERLDVLEDLNGYDQTREFLGPIYQSHWIGLENKNARVIQEP